MENAPPRKSIGDRLKCCKCNRALPPCKWFTAFYSTTHGQYVHMCNGGQYYRPVGQDGKCECEYCFNKPIRKQEEMMRQNAKKREEEQQKRKEDMKREEVRQRREERRQQEQQRKEEERRQRQAKINNENEITHLDGYWAECDSSSDRNDLLEILSVRCSVSVPDLSLTRLSADQLGNILSVLDKLLFDEWINTRPSLSTLQHAQVFITELCFLSVETFQGGSVQNISHYVQLLLESMSQSACDVLENFLLTQALYLSLMHFLKNHSSSDTDAVLIAKQWAEYELSTEQLFLIDFLGTLTSSLQKAAERATVFISKMEIQCLKLLLSTLTQLNAGETYSESTEILLRLVQTNQWTPMEAVTLLKALSQKYADSVSVIEVLRLVQVYDLSPDWTDGSGQSLIQVLDSDGPEGFNQDLQKTLRREDETSLDVALSELKMSWNFDDSSIYKIRHITTGVLRYCHNKYAPLMKKPFKCVTLNADDLQNSLSQLCKAVYDTKGWWPTVKQMLQWCALVLTEQSKVPQLVGVEEDQCVTAMFVAIQICRGNKLDIVLGSDVHLEERTKAWSDFYKHLGISVNTNTKTSNASFREVYDADIVFGTVDNFVSDYIQHGIEVMETGSPQLCRGFIIEEQSLSESHNLGLSRLKANDSQVFAAEVLQSLMGKFYSEDKELGHRFVKALFQLLHTKMNKDTHTGNKIITLSKKIVGRGLSSNEVFILSFLENLLRVFTEEKENETNRASPAGKWCLQILIAYVAQLQGSKKQTEELFQMVLNLEGLRLWSPVESFNLLAVLTDYHYDEGCISIMKILHMLATYQVSSKWTDSNNQSLLKLVHSTGTWKLIKHLERSLRHEKTKSINTLFDEIRQMKDIDEQTLSRSYSVVTHVANLIGSGDIKNYTEVQWARMLSHSRKTEDLQELLAVLCNAVHLYRAEGKWWPRVTQMISWCILALSDTGKLVEMGTGEGKSCVIAMFAALRALRGEKVDVVSTSPVLCERDAVEWNNFYNFFEITADTNINKNDDESKKQCYQRDIVYGTTSDFAADHLHQTFSMRDVRPNRGYQCIIIDEVDSLLLDEGAHTTYLSIPMASMQHLNIILTVIWSHVSQYGFLSTEQKTCVRGPPSSFFKAIFDSLNTEGTEVSDPADILCIAEEFDIVPKGFTEELFKSEKDEVLRKLKTVGQDVVIDFFYKLEDCVPYRFTLYSLDDQGLLCLQKCCQDNSQDTPVLTFLVLEDGLCCPLYDSEETLIKPIAELISERIQYTPCTNSESKISVPGFLKTLVGKKMSVWVQNAFQAMQMKEGKEYVVEKDNVYPVDFRSTGIVQVNQHWTDGLHQFLEIKHQVKRSTISTMTNYFSNISLFQKYHGKIYGTTGTLGSKTEMLFLRELYPNLYVCKLPTFNRKKLFQVKGGLKSSAEDWKSEIKRVVLAQISPNSYRGGRAALVICETINEAVDIYNELKSSTPGEIILYCRSDINSSRKIEKKLLPGDVIVATNLAGRGSDIKVSKQVNSNGGLFVVLSFLSQNTRVEQQAFGRTARKGAPGSAQIIISTEHLQPSFRTVSSLEEAKSTRDGLAVNKINHMRNQVTELKLKEDLFSEYVKTLQDIHKNTHGHEKRALVAIMNEFWGVWLQVKSEEIHQLKRKELQKSLTADLSLAKSQSQRQTSPCSSIYHYIQFGNIALNDEQWDTSARLFEKAMNEDESWAAIAFYNHAYCTIQQRSANYLTKATDDLKKAQESLKYLCEEPIVCLMMVKMVTMNSANSEPTSLEKQLANKCIMLTYLAKNITEAIQKLDEIKDRGRDAVTNTSYILSLVSNADEDLQKEASQLDSQGLHFVFSVEEKSQFPWGGVLVFCLGVLQIVGGALLITSTCVTLSFIGKKLMEEGFSDCIYGIQSIVTGDFSWKSWAVTKAVSVGTSLVLFGLGKVIAKGLKPCKIVSKGAGKNMSSIGVYAKGISKATAKTCMKNLVERPAKKMVREIMIYGLGKVEEKILEEVQSKIKNEVKEGIAKNVRSNMRKWFLSTTLDHLVLSQLQEERQLHDLWKDKSSRGELLAYFRDLIKNGEKSFYTDPSWQNKLNSSISTVIDRAKAEARGTSQSFLRAIQDAHQTALAREAMNAALSLSGKFFSNFEEQLNMIKTETGLSRTVKVNELSPSGREILRKFKQDLANTISASLADSLLEVFHQRFTSHTVPLVHGKVNSIIGHHVKTGLNTDRTEELHRAEQNNRYITYMPVNSRNDWAAEAGEHSRSHAEVIINPMTPGSILDIRVLSEATGTNVVILTQDSSGRHLGLELSPNTRPARQTVTLIYRPRSAEYPDGHYDVQINNQTVIIDNEDRSCLFHAFARGLNQGANDTENPLDAQDLRFMVANTLLTYPGKWEPFVKRKVWTESIRGGDWFMLEGGARRFNKKRLRKLYKKLVGRVQTYQYWLAYKLQRRGIGCWIHADHQPPVSCINIARRRGWQSRLLKAILEVATNSSTPNNNLIDRVLQNRCPDLITVLVPAAIHMECPSTRSEAFRVRLTEAMRDDDVEGTFKLMILGSMPRFRLKKNKNFKTFQDSEENQINLAVFEDSFQQHSIEMVETWFKLLQNKDIMTETHRDNIIKWIERRGYDDQNDPYRNEVSDLL